MVRTLDIYRGDGDCTVDDFCADTPNAGQPNYDCASVKNSCSDPGNDMTQNYMDYTNDACMDTFTNDQKTPDFGCYG